jgi:hypothetical protein
MSRIIKRSFSRFFALIFDRIMLYSNEVGNFIVCLDSTNRDGTASMIKKHGDSIHAHLKMIAALILIAGLFCSCTTHSPENKGWDQVSDILSRIVPPVFPDQDVIITHFGAEGDGETDCTESFQQAIQACHDADGGRVLVPAGIYSTGAFVGICAQDISGASLAADFDYFEYAEA